MTTANTTYDSAAPLPGGTSTNTSITCTASTTTTSTATSTDDDHKYRILALYKFVSPPLPEEKLPIIKLEMETFCLKHQVRGSLLLATEGINGTISYPLLLENQKSEEEKGEDNQDDSSAVVEDPVLHFLCTQFPGLRTRISYSPTGHVFYRLKIKLKKDILTCRLADDNDTEGVCLDPTQQVGTYVKPGPEWDALLQDPNCLVVDARNDYEVRLGTFHNAKNPKTTIFSELLPWMKEQLAVTKKPTKIAMFCTGGIRCEKATAAVMDLVQQQQQQSQSKQSSAPEIPVYHLEGGILAYLDQVPSEKSQFEGACYVFDQRVAVTHGLEAVPNMTLCHACRAPLTAEQQEGHADFVQGQQCTYCVDDVAKRTAKQQERYESRQHQIQLAQQKGFLHIHDPKEKVLSVLAQSGKEFQEKQQQKNQRARQKRKEKKKEDCSDIKTN